MIPKKNELIYKNELRIGSIKLNLIKKTSWVQFNSWSKTGNDQKLECNQTLRYIEWIEI